MVPSMKTLVLCTVVCIFVACRPVASFEAKQGSDPLLTYTTHGDDWPGMCKKGKKQSPINIVTTKMKEISSTAGMVEVESLGTVSGAKVFLTSKLSHVEVEWEQFIDPPSIRIPAAKNGDILAPLSGKMKASQMKWVEVAPAQFHFHTPSENSVDGLLSAGVVHIVNLVKDGQSAACDKKKARGDGPCIVVLSVFLSQGTLYSPFDHLFRRMLRADNKASFPHGRPHHAVFERPVIKSVGKAGEVHAGFFDLNALLPTKSDYATWSGSLTTYPCTEEVLWVQFLHPIPISFEQLKLLETTIARAAGGDCRTVRQGKCYPSRPTFNNRAVQPMNGRDVSLGYAY